MSRKDTIVNLVSISKKFCAHSFQKGIGEMPTQVCIHSEGKLNIYQDESGDLPGVNLLEAALAECPGDLAVVINEFWMNPDTSGKSFASKMTPEERKEAGVREGVMIRVFDTQNLDNALEIHSAEILPGRVLGEWEKVGEVLSSSRPRDPMEIN